LGAFSAPKSGGETMKTIKAVAIAALILLSLGCAKKSTTANDEAGVGADRVSGEAPKPGALLAYEHELRFSVAPETMNRRITAVQTACNQEKFGACSVLGIESSSGDYASASIVLRAEPAGIESLVALAGEDAVVEKRTTKAEDLADAVADVKVQQDLLKRQRETLLIYVARKDLAVADMIALSQQIATVESTLQALSQQSADQRRRIETNRLSIELRSNILAGVNQGISIRESWDTFTNSLIEGINDCAEYAGYLMPVLLLVFPLALFWRWLWRLATRRSSVRGQGQV